MATANPLKLQRMNRTRFLSDTGILILIALVGCAWIIYQYPIDFMAGIRSILKSVSDLFALKYYIVSVFAILSILFSYLYICRMMDRGVSPFISALPLLLFYGTFTYFFYAFFVLLQETNFLEFFAKAKRFFEQPSLNHFETLFSQNWRNFLDQKKVYLDIAIFSSYFLLLTGMLIPGTKGENRYGLPKLLKTPQLIGALLVLVLLVIYVYGTIPILFLDSPSQYFKDYDAFISLLDKVRGI